ncbi:MAG: hypothetical protein EHM34_04095 [Nitrosopumilales archaeon]|nr:MAG: hypothetical protein EHM34_04095 [Nitrosopumilales archaeon]
MDIKCITYPDLNSFSYWLPRPDYKGDIIIPRITIDERLFNHKIIWEAKCDGSNAGIWMDAGGKIQVRTRNQEYAQENIRTQILAIPHVTGIMQALRDFSALNVDVVFFGEWMAKGRSSARFELHEQDSFQVFDIWNDSEHRWFNFYEKTKICWKYRIEMVELVEVSEVSTLDELIAVRDRLVKFCIDCKNREGVVGKVYIPNTPYVNFFKEKVEEKPAHKPEKVHEDDPRPELPDSEIYGAIDKAYMDMPPDQFHDIRYAMPKIAELVKHECEKHECKCTKKLIVYYKQKIEDIAKSV